MVDDAASGDAATIRRRANALALAVLAQLAERPMHPYEIARTLKDRRKDESVRLNYGSLYSVITALVRDGLIEPAGTEQDGNRPQRTVYRLTGAGRTEVDDWMRALLGAPVKEYPQFMAALSFLPLLAPDDVADLLRTRLVALRVKVRRIEDDLEDLEHTDGARGETSELAVAGSRYELAILRAELAYADVLVRRIADGTLGGIEAWRAAVR
ncbi:PadR family transcriptional regulator [Oerskovia enterophila]|uniref:Transcriptional regulator PadR-like family protein n=1 Tax=Oerskovia enterophila TaxID=43678 RepID=A0ABX2Y9P0_9CELL|nr:PadR family transcriptional regulator [Oerskovia enterophila]OCI33215.1 transcriptional regulator PadR-like family protein [Oerskovia enterophila]